MPKVKGPLFSLEAHGTLNDTLTYQDINARPVVKANNFPTYRRSDDQGEIRDTFSWAIYVWHKLHPLTQQLWRDHTDPQLLTGYKAFMSSFLNRTYIWLNQFQFPDKQGFCGVGDYTVANLITGGPFLYSGSEPFS